MATIKSYSDLQQSKKLSEILPLESADMYYEDDISVEFGHGWHSQHIPCWSLAALLGVLPDYSLQTNIDGTVFVVCESKKPMISDSYNNPVDACVAMIEKLHKLKML